MKGSNQDRISRQKTSSREDQEVQRKLLKTLLPDYEMCSSSALLNEGVQTDLTKDGVEEKIAEFSQWSVEKETEGSNSETSVVSESRFEAYKDDNYLMPDFIGIKFSERPRILLKNVKKKTTITVDPENLLVDEINLKISDWPVGELYLSIGGFELFPRRFSEIPDYISVSTEHRKYSLDENMFLGSMQSSERQRAAWRQKERLERLGLSSPRSSEKKEDDRKQHESFSYHPNDIDFIKRNLRSSASTGVQTLVQMDVDLSDWKSYKPEDTIQNQAIEIAEMSERYSRDVSSTGLENSKQTSGISSLPLNETKQTSFSGLNQTQEAKLVSDADSFHGEDKPEETAEETNETDLENKRTKAEMSFSEPQDDQFLPRSSVSKERGSKRVYKSVLFSDETYYYDQNGKTQEGKIKPGDNLQDKKVITENNILADSHLSQTSSTGSDNISERALKSEPLSDEIVPLDQSFPVNEEEKAMPADNLQDSKVTDENNTLPDSHLSQTSSMDSRNTSGRVLKSESPSDELLQNIPVNEEEKGIISADLGDSKTPETNITGTSSAYPHPQEDILEKNDPPSLEYTENVPPASSGGASNLSDRQSNSGREKLYNPRSSLLEIQQELARPFMHDRENFRGSSLQSNPEDILNKSPARTPPKPKK